MRPRNKKTKSDNRKMFNQSNFGKMLKTEGDHISKT